MIKWEDNGDNMEHGGNWELHKLSVFFQWFFRSSEFKTGWLMMGWKANDMNLL